MGAGLDWEQEIRVDIGIWSSLLRRMVAKGATVW